MLIFLLSFLLSNELSFAADREAPKKSPPSVEVRLWDFSRPQQCISITEYTPCVDSRICRWNRPSIMMGGRPIPCGWVQQKVPKVCCAFPQILGTTLENKVSEEIARNRECGTRLLAPNLSRTENKFYKIANSLPEIDTSNPERFDPPLEIPMNYSWAIGGRASKRDEHPWMVAIIKGSVFWCGGVLIDRSHVLTAAHCFVTTSESPDPAKYSVRIGDIEFNQGSVFAVSKIKVHENYLPMRHYNDIAVLTLEKEVLNSTIPNICLHDSETAVMNYTGKVTTLLGWGDTEFGGSISTILQVVEDLPIWSNAECDRVYRRFEQQTLPNGITDDFICAGLDEGGKDACQSDSGGPLLYLKDGDSTPHWVLVGIVSFGFMCGEPGYPGVYTRVSTFMDWIKLNT